MIKLTTKRQQISKTTANMIKIVSVATVIIVFCLVSTKVLLSQAAYQRRLVNARHATLKQLKVNEQAIQTLLDQYSNVFQNDSPTNIIGGKNDKSSTAVPPNGDNARIVLDALPTTYDFPGLISSVAKILATNNIGAPSITGTDESASVNNPSSSSPQAIAIKLTIGGQGTYDQVQSVVRDLERSIRPFDITTTQLNGTNANISFNLNATTYYQPAKTLETDTKKVQ